MEKKPILGLHVLFLKSLPEYLQEIRIRANVSRPITAIKKSSRLQQTGTYKLGQRVSHSKFGEGVGLTNGGGGCSRKSAD